MGSVEGAVGREYIASYFFNNFCLEDSPHPLFVDNVVQTAQSNVGVEVGDSRTHENVPVVHELCMLLLLLRQVGVVDRQQALVHSNDGCPTDSVGPLLLQDFTKFESYPFRDVVRQ